jgi:hypothetical protein
VQRGASGQRHSSVCSCDRAPTAPPTAPLGSASCAARRAVSCFCKDAAPAAWGCLAQLGARARWTPPRFSARRRVAPKTKTLRAFLTAGRPILKPPHPPPGGFLGGGGLAPSRSLALPRPLCPIAHRLSRPPRGTGAACKILRGFVAAHCNKAFTEQRHCSAAAVPVQRFCSTHRWPAPALHYKHLCYSASVPVPVLYLYCIIMQHAACTGIKGVCAAR